MSITIHVDAYSGFRPNERPIRFWLDATLHENELTGVYEIDAVEDRWYDPNAEYFKVRTPEGKRYVIRFDQHEDRWTLQSGFDGTELLARPGIEVLTVEPEAIRKAQALITGCERCRPKEADHRFADILADALHKHGPYEFILSETAHCPNCRGELLEKTLVEPQGGVEIDARLELSPR